MNNQAATFGQFQPDDLEQVPGGIGADRQHSGRVSIRLKVDNDQGMVERVSNRLLVDSVSLSRSVHLHTHIS